MPAPDVRLVARIGKPHGLRGEVTVQTHTDDPQARFAPGTGYATEAAAGSGVPRSLTIRSARLHRQIWLLAFEEIPDRSGAESLRGTRLLIEATEDAVPGDPATSAGGEADSWYEEDLLGLAAVDPAGTVVGEITGLVVGAAQDLLQVRLGDGRTALVPFVEEIVPEVEVDAGRVVIDAPPGLFDLAE